MRPATQQLPGRLRLRFTLLKQQAETLERMADALGQVPGVIAVETSPAIGGLLIHFDPATGNTAAFWDRVEAVLQAHQLLVNPRPLARQGSAGARP